MQVYNVEIFDRNFNFIHNYTVEDITYKYDYLTPVENEVMMSYNANVKVGNYIILRSEERRFEGVISSLQVINKDFMTVGYSPLNSLFNITTFIDVEYQRGGTNAGTKAIEQLIYDYLKYAYIDGHSPDVWWDSASYDTDNLQKIPGLTLTKLSNTYDWNIGLTLEQTSVSAVRWMGNVYDDLLPRVLKGCAVGVITTLDIQNHKIDCKIGVLNSDPQTIEMGLPQILQHNIVETDTTNLCNKYVMIPPSETGNDPTVYYRHPDGTWDTSDTDRLTPVIVDVGESMSDIDEGDTVETRLFNKYGGLLYVNLIELTTILGIFDLEFGDIANVIVGNTQYTSMLTGYEIKDNIVKYSFGMLRLDLTKILKGRLKNGK